MRQLLAAALLGLAGTAFSQNKTVVAPAAPVTVGAPVGSVARPVYRPSADYRSQAALDLQQRLDLLPKLSPYSQERFLNTLFENAESAVAAGAPAGRAPKAKPINFGDLVIQRANFSEKTRISAILVGLIDRAQTTLDLALHGLSLPDVAQALLRARERGVKIRIIMNHSHTFAEREGQKISPEVTFLIENKFDMRTLRGGGPYGVMHNKIAIVDRKVMKLGSFNWTNAADTRNYENAVFFDDAAKIARYEKTYEKLWASAKPVGEGTLTAWPLTMEAERLMWAEMASEETIDYNGEKFSEEMYSPKGGTEAALLRAINATKKELAIAMFSLTSDPIVEALIAADARGVKVRLVVDKSQGVGRAMAGDIKKLMDAGVDIVWASGHQPRGVMHNKFAVFDRKMLEVGSFNWTNNAEHNNYENANFTLDPELIEDFLAEFEDIYTVGTTPTPKEAAHVEALIQAGHFDPFRPAESEKTK